MVRVVRIYNFCDWCFKRDGMEIVSLGSIQFSDEGKAKRYDYCEDAKHADPAWSDMRELASDDTGKVTAATASVVRGRPTRRSQDQLEAAGELETCPVCSVRIRSISTHLSSVHDLNAKRVRGDDGEYHCPICKTHYPRSVSLGPHMRKAHDVNLGVYLLDHGYEAT